MNLGIPWWRKREPDAVEVTPGAREVPGRFYGDGGTIHGTTHVDVQIGPDGHVVAVWFRCSLLPFKESRVDEARAQSMAADDQPAPLAGIVFREEVAS